MRKPATAERLPDHRAELLRRVCTTNLMRAPPGSAPPRRPSALTCSMYGGAIPPTVGNVVTPDQQRPADPYRSPLARTHAATTSAAAPARSATTAAGIATNTPVHSITTTNRIRWVLIASSADFFPNGHNGNLAGTFTVPDSWPEPPNRTDLGRKNLDPQ